jgi:transposase-like protein
VIAVSSKGKRYSPTFRFQVVLELLKGDREATEIARVYNIHPVSVSRWKQEFLEKGAESSGKEVRTMSGQRNKTLRRIALGVAIASFLVTLLVACSRGPVTYDEAEELEAQVKDLSTRLQKIEEGLSGLQSASEEEVSASMQDQIEATRSELSEVVARLAEIEEALSVPEAPAEPAQPAPGQPIPGGTP